ncbi:MAG TPA: transglycosylase domain-containing protein [Dictyobacter sp.]|nr:transglycosylase domain-containing protein [Dictyobacter sp.]
MSDPHFYHGHKKGNKTLVARRDGGRNLAQRKFQTTTQEKRRIGTEEEKFDPRVVEGTADIIADYAPYFSRAHKRMLRRMRINRIVLHKRRYGRRYQYVEKKLTMTLLVFLSVLIVLCTVGSGVIYTYYQAQLPLLNSIAQHSLFQTTRIYDRNGKMLDEIYDNAADHGRRTYVDYKDISSLLVNATVAAEDHSFWINNGVDYQGIVRAAISDIVNNGVVEGGSTITEQLIKNQFFMGQPRNVQIKGEEAILATGLTQQYPKWKIIEMYLNTVFYGDRNFGVEAAAEDYFGLKPTCNQNGRCQPVVAHLTLGQASLLAGLPQSPSAYMPLVYQKSALERQSHVLASMLELGMITSQQKAQAEREMSHYKFHTYGDAHKKLAPHFDDYIVSQLIPLLGADNLNNGGYNIYTTLDLNLEKKVEQVTYDHLYKNPVNDYISYGVLSQVHNVNNAAVVVIDPKTGEILAMNGSARYTMDTPQVRGESNVALLKRPPGSSFKPIVYATAFEMGWYPAMVVPDHLTHFPVDTTTYTPPNYDGKFHGDMMTVRRAIANSFNIPAVDAFMYAGPDNVMNMAARLGLTNVASVPRNNRGPAMALGTNDETLLNMTSAYATFANGGVRMPTVAIRKITDSEGHIIYQYHDQHPHGVRVMRQDIAYLMSSILSDKAARYEEFGPGNPLELDRPAAAKTGTTDDFRDNWTLGYTPHLAVGVWAGNSDDTQMNNVIGITGAGPIWHDVMEYASHAYHFPADDFVRPADVHQAAVSALTGLAPYPGDVTVRDWFIDGTVPTIRGWGSYGLPAAPTQKSPAHSSDKDPWQIGPWKIDPWKLIPWFDPHTGNADW